MRRQTLEYVCATCRRQIVRGRPLHPTGRRYVQISATPSATQQQHLDALASGSNGSPPTDARFEVLGSTSSLLSASISASQNLYTRKGTLVGFNGKAEETVSTLSLLEPFRRALFGVPFVYQRVTSTAPYTALIATKNAVTNFVVVHLDGRLDWMLTQRNALAAWTGHTLKLSPRVNTRMSLSRWGNTHVTGRGLLALSGKGQIHQISLKTGEEYVVHPSNVVAYSILQHAPQPYRFKSNMLRFQIPAVSGWFPDTRFFREMRKTAVYRYARDLAFLVRTWARRTIWGDRLFLHFHGPCQILMQSRGSSIRDVLTSRDVNEIADSPAGAIPDALTAKSAAEGETVATTSPRQQTTTVSYATVQPDGRASFGKAPGTGDGKVANPAEV